MLGFEKYFVIVLVFCYFSMKFYMTSIVMINCSDKGMSKGPFTPRTLTILVSTPTHNIVLFILSTCWSYADVCL